MSRLFPVVLGAVLVALLTAWSCLFTIDETKQAIVVQFGEPRRTVKEPGLHFKLPWEQVEKMERRVMGTDSPPSTFFTRDKKRLVIDPITRWRVEEPLTFYKKMRNEIGAKARLDDIINSELRKQLARREFDEIVCVHRGSADEDDAGSTAPEAGQPADEPKEDQREPAAEEGKKDEEAKPAAQDGARTADADKGQAPDTATPPTEPKDKVRQQDRAAVAGPQLPCGRERVMEEVTGRVRKICAELGISVLDVRMKRTDLPNEVEKSVFDRMRAERERVAAKYRSEGEEENLKIRAETDKTTAILLAEAYESAQELRGEGDGESTRIYAEAFGRDPEFYAFVRSLDTYDKGISDKSTLVMSTGSPLFRYLQEHRQR